VGAGTASDAAEAGLGDLDAGEAGDGAGALRDAQAGASNVDAATANDTDAGSASPDAGDGKQCLPGLSACGTLCVDLSSSAANCGACGKTCPGEQACNGSGECLAPSGCSYRAFGDHEYFFCSTTKQWTAARADCLSFGLDLVVIESQEENDFVEGASNQWIGYNDRDSEGGFLWVPRGNGGSTQGPSAPFTRWRDGEPNNRRSCTLGICTGPGEDCAEIQQGGLWNDAACDDARAFVCETY
jgi:hypothetical protein